MEEYAAPSPPCGPRSGTADRQISLPERLSSATSVAARPPGVTTTLLPSTSGDSRNFHLDIIRPPKSLLRFLRQRSLPVAASTHTRSLSVPSAYTRSPSTVGVPRGPGYSSSCAGPSFVRHSSLPPSALNAMTNWSPLRSPIVNTRPLTTETLENPAPSPFARHFSLGPPSGHCCSSPVSGERFSRLGPRNCGHSPGEDR